MLAASYVAAQEGDEIIVSTDPDHSTSGPVEDCCGVEAEGGSSSYVAAGLVAAAAAAFTIAGLTDERDAMRRGEDETPPAEGEVTVAEVLEVAFDSPEAVALGKPFSVKTDWSYTRQTTGANYTHSASDTFQNIHVLSRYEIEAPEVFVNYTKDEFWIVKGSFFNADGKQLRGDQLFVQCFLAGPNGEWRKLIMQMTGTGRMTTPVMACTPQHIPLSERRKGYGVTT